MKPFSCWFGHKWRAIHVHHYETQRKNSAGEVVHSMHGTNVTYRCIRCEDTKKIELKDAGHIALTSLLPNAVDVEAEVEAALNKMKGPPNG